MKIEPILNLKNEEEISSLFYDEVSNRILVGTSQGRILIVKQLASNMYLMGNRSIYAQTTSCYGDASPMAVVNLKYGLKNKIIELTDTMEIVRWKSVNYPAGAESFGTVSGIFTTPILWAGEDFGWWGNTVWNQTVESGGRVLVAIRVAGSEDAILSAPWNTYESSDSGEITWSLDNFSIAGSYAQAKIILQSSLNGLSPVVSNFVIPYYSKHASYFFVTKITMKKGSAIKGGLLTASVSAPPNTEIKWGITGGNSSSWNDYSPVYPDKLFQILNNPAERIKIGAKLLSYDNENYPTIDEFAVAFDADIDNLINQT